MKIVIVKKTKSAKNPEDSFIIRAFVFKVPTFKTREEFVRIIKENEFKNINPERLKIINHEVVTYPKNGTDCVKSYSVLEDRDAAKQVGKTGVMLQESVSLICAHPKNIDVGVSVGYSQRYFPGQGDPGFLEKAASVFNSVEFTDL